MADEKVGRIFAGTSGFAYKTWRPDFYPGDLAEKKFLEYYGTRLTALEINYTYRRLASANVLNSWMKQTPEGFHFAPKAHMRITHMDRLTNTSGFLRTFLDSLTPLAQAKRLGPILFQLGPTQKADPVLLGSFLEQCPGGIRYAFEFRHKSWFDEPVYEVLKKRGVALCFAETEDLKTPRVETAPFQYFRLRNQHYTEEWLEAFATGVQSTLNRGTDVYVFFKHEDDPSGALYADWLLKRIAHAHAM